MRVEEYRDDKHIGHSTYDVETIHDNAVEYTVWAYCRTCSQKFMRTDVSVTTEPDWSDIKDELEDIEPRDPPYEY